MMNVVIVGAAAVLHVVAALMALRLVRVTGGRIAWMVICVAVLVQAVRRSIAFYNLLSCDADCGDTLDDLLALSISVFMVGGLALIKPLFLTIKHSEQVLLEANIKAAEEKIQREKIITELQDALVNIKELKRLIPICSYCKKIRDDDGYWHQLEAYFKTHGDAEFSHGICPVCYEDRFSSAIKMNEEKK
jgi:hypothetical protein